MLNTISAMKNEEAVLEKAFPEYQAYKSSTARLIQGLLRLSPDLFANVAQ